LFANLKLHHLGISEYFIYGITLGLAAGIAPGPLLAMVISETLKGNKMNGIFIAIAPLITDIPIVLFSVFILKSFSDTDLVIGILSIFGALFLIYLGIQNFRFNPNAFNTNSSYTTSIKYGVITNVLSPHPYLFWITVGAPTFITAGKTGSANSYVFVIGFYLLLVGSKMLIALISGRIKGFLNSTAYHNIMKIIGLVLFIFSGFMMYKGIQMIWN